jgi:hypothetical protein
VGADTAIVGPSDEASLDPQAVTNKPAKTLAAQKMTRIRPID